MAYYDAKRDYPGMMARRELDVWKAKVNSALFRYKIEIF